MWQALAGPWGWLSSRQIGGVEAGGVEEPATHTLAARPPPCSTATHADTQSECNAHLHSMIGEEINVLLVIRG